jgi:hypothetical protein
MGNQSFDSPASKPGLPEPFDALKALSSIEGLGSKAQG